jgi:hypothetical protein
VKGRLARDECGRGAMSGVEGQGMARLGEEAEGRRRGLNGGVVSSARRGGEAGAAGPKAGCEESCSGRGVVRNAGWSSTGTGVGEVGRRVGCTVSSFSADIWGPGCDVGGSCMGRDGAVRLVRDEVLDDVARDADEADREPDSSSLDWKAWGGRAGSGRLCGAGSGLLATLFFDASHSGAAKGALSFSSQRFVAGTWFLELPRSGMADTGSFSSSLKRARGSISAMASDDTWIVISCECAVKVDS